jgi:hypothetical protein
VGLSFLNGAFLGGLSLVGIPILIHLLQRRRFRVVEWGAMEFLRLSERKRSRRIMIEQLLLLLIRCLIITCVVLAVCRPVVRFGSIQPNGVRGQVHAILIVDNSYSMGYRTGGAGSETVFDRARARALEVVERGLRQGDAVSVVLASDPPQVLIRKASLDLRAAAGTLRRLSLSDATTNFGQAARVALAIAGESVFPNREVYLVSDLQDAGWTGRGSDPSAWEALERLARLILVPVREGFAANAAVQWVQAARGLATARTSSRIQARILNAGPQAMRGLPVSLEIDGRPLGASQNLDLEPGQAGIVAFNHLFEQPGVHASAVRIGTDRLPGDDAAHLALRVRKSVRVLVVNGNPNGAVPQKDAAFFLMPALAPPVPAAGGEPTPVEPQMVIGSGFGSAQIRDYDVVVLSDVRELSAADRRSLAEFVQNGGGALIFLGAMASGPIYNRDLLDATPSLLPARVGTPASDKVFLDAGSLDHPALERFRGAQDVDVNTAEFLRYYRLQPKEGDRTVRVMARFTSGQPALVERGFGLGRVVLAASPATTEWGTLPLKPMFLPLVHQLVAYLAAGTDGTRNGRVGEPVVKPLPLNEAGRPVDVIDPGGGRTTLRSAVDDRGCTVTIDRPQRAGFYRIEVSRGTQDTFAVNRDTRESVLRSLDRRTVEQRLNSRTLTWIGINEDLMSALTRSRQGVEFWRHLLIAALVLLVTETMLAQMFGRRA